MTNNINHLAERYYETGDPDVLKKLEDKLNWLIYTYPGKAYGDEERGAEFYEFMRPRIGEIIEKGRNISVRFLSWFAVVMRNRYFNMLEHYKSRQYLQRSAPPLSYEGVAMFLAEKLSPLFPTGEGGSVCENINQLLRERPRAAVIMKFRHPVLLEESDCQRYAAYHRFDQRTYQRTVELLKRENQQFFSRVSQLKEKEGEVYLIIENLEYELLLAAEQEEIMELESRLRKKKEQLENVRKKLETAKERPTHRQVAKILGMNYNSYYHQYRQTAKYLREELAEMEKS